jgi:hypothetical protein
MFPRLPDSFWDMLLTFLDAMPGFDAFTSRASALASVSARLKPEEAVAVARALIETMATRTENHALDKCSGRPVGSACWSGSRKSARRRAGSRRKSWSICSRC